jgi:hypothetical protein
MQVKFRPGNKINYMTESNQLLEGVPANIMFAVISFKNPSIGTEVMRLMPMLPNEHNNPGIIYVDINDCNNSADRVALRLKLLEQGFIKTKPSKEML